jgi:hypothetical protein
LCCVPSEYTLQNGSTLVSETNTSGLTTVAIASSSLPEFLIVTANNSLFTFVTAVRTSIETNVSEVVSEAVGDWSIGNTLAENGSLWMAHADEWMGNVWSSRVEFVG